MTLLALPVSDNVIVLKSCPDVPVLGRKQLDAHFGRSCKGMSLTDFTYLLSLVSDTLSDLRCLSTSQLIYLVHLSALLLREHPSRRTRTIVFFISSTNFSLPVRYFGSISEVRDTVYQ